MACEIQEIEENRKRRIQPVRNVQVSASLANYFQSQEVDFLEEIDELKRNKTPSGSCITTSVQDIRKFYSPVKESITPSGSNLPSSQSSIFKAKRGSPNREIQPGQADKIKDKARTLAKSRTKGRSASSNGSMDSSQNNNRRNLSDSAVEINMTSGEKKTRDVN